ncbi:MAG: ABC transporter ATP-binding protein [Deltaproteobacteria bacterium]|nr:ABC transporter ATP-binding protein [Deltaproteobacteria bacterium]
MFLTLENVHTFYGRSHILQGINLEVGVGELVILIGRNGVGKTTTLKTIMGIQSAKQGTITLDGDNITHLKPHQIAAKGIAFVPEERRIIPNLTVLENLRLAMLVRGKLNQAEINGTLEEVFSNFPRLKERLGNRGDALSGGEQQMLALARAMVAKPRIILVDEPSEGVMPILVDEIAEILKRFLADGVTILLVEQNYEMAFGLHDSARVYIMEKGAICHACGIQSLIENREPLQKFCGIQM